MTACEDPYCPCRDGLQCHYTGVDAMPRRTPVKHDPDGGTTATDATRIDTDDRIRGTDGTDVRLQAHFVPGQNMELTLTVGYCQGTLDVPQILRMRNLLSQLLGTGFVTRRATTNGTGDTTT